MIKQSLKIVFIFVFASLAQLSALWASLAQNHYYPLELVKHRQSLHLRTITEEQQEKLAQLLRATLSQVHLVTKGQPDTLHTQCPGEKPRHSQCVEQRRNISYKEARQYLFGHLHLERDSRGSYFLKDQYCQNTLTSRHGVGPMKIPNSRHVNCEHTWPQSRFNRRFSAELQKTDLHHLFPVDNSANSSRSNLPFGDAQNTSSQLCDASNRGPALNSGVLSFEPPEQHKGNVARAHFYFALRYEVSIPDYEMEYLKIWNRLDPVDLAERRRNDQIYEIQGNRNPFIDDEALVEFISL